jgi:hypothetical protein
MKSTKQPEQPKDSAGWRTEVARILAEADELRTKIAGEFAIRKTAALARDDDGFEASILRVQGFERHVEKLGALVEHGALQLRVCQEREEAAAAAEFANERNQAAEALLRYFIDIDRAGQALFDAARAADIAKEEFRKKFGASGLRRTSHIVRSVLDNVDKRHEFLFANVTTWRASAETICRSTFGSSGAKAEISGNDEWLKENAPAPMVTAVELAPIKREKPKSTWGWPGVPAENFEMTEDPTLRR